VEAYLGGQAIGEAIVNVLFGKVNPSGRLAETFPKKLEDNPSYLFFKGEKDIVEYREGVFVGYRYYETKKIDVLFPFGHGLSYTQFAYSNMTIDRTKMKDTELLTVEVEVTNIGERAGKEVVQLYICPPNSEVIRPVIELRGFEKVTLEAGEKKKVSFTLDKRAFAYWEKTLHDWHVVTGEYKISIGKSARELLLAKEVYVEATKTLSTIYHMNSTMGDIMKDPKGKKILEAMQAQMLEGTGAREMEQSAQEGGGVGVINDEMLKATMENMPLRQLLSFVPGIQKEQIQQLINALNNH
jgi:beta-glucosidase